MRQDFLKMKSTADFTGKDYNSDAMPVRLDSMRELRAKRNALTDNEGYEPVIRSVPVKPWYEQQKAVMLPQQ
jgi:hypothetical protein